MAYCFSKPISTYTKKSSVLGEKKPRKEELEKKSSNQMAKLKKYLCEVYV